MIQKFKYYFNLCLLFHNSCTRNRREDICIVENESVHLEISQNSFDSQKPSTSKTALKHGRKPYYHSDSSDDSFDSKFTSKQSKSVSNDNTPDDHKVKISVSELDFKKCRKSSTDSTEGENSDFISDGNLIYFRIKGYDV